jgi:RNA-directed DNA polymerase
MIISDIQHKLAKWAEEDPNRRFDRLLRLIANRDWLAEAARIVLTSNGAKTSGIDNINRDRFRLDQEVYLTQLRLELMEGTYTPSPVKRIYIPKANGKLRPLGIPTLIDRIVQRAMLMAMEPIWESDFNCHSYGFRPQRSVHHAVRAVQAQLTDHRYTKGRWIIEGDLASYFDTIHHRKLVSCVRKRIRDKRFIALLWRILKSGHIDKGLFLSASEGVPQGGVLSPLLSNIMLHEFDSWMNEKYLSQKARNKRNRWNRSMKTAPPSSVQVSQRWKPAVSYCRYADDFIIIVKGTKAHATAIRAECRAFLEDDLKLTLNMEKTKVTHVNDGFVFLGHRFIRNRGGRGKMRVVTTIPKEKIKAFKHRLIKTLDGNHNMDPKDMIDSINRQLIGWANFYQFTIYTAKVFQRIDYMIFWKMARWLGRKYRSRIKPLMRKWFKRPRGQTAKTWVVIRSNKLGELKVGILHRLIQTRKRIFKWKTPRVNPYLHTEDQISIFYMRYRDLALAFSQT